MDGAGAGDLVHHDTIVLGAGIAGLAFASRLLQASANVNGANGIRVLEARDRIGGRVACVHVQGYRLDTGANWIHGTGNADRRNPLVDVLPNKRYRSLKGSVLFQAPEFDDRPSSRDGDTRRQCSREDSLDPLTPLTCSIDASSGLIIPCPMASLINSCARNAIGEAQDLAGTAPAGEAKHISVLKALVDAKSFQAAFDDVPREHHRTLGALFQGIESMEAAPLVAWTAESGRPESQPGVGLLEYAVNDFDGEQAFLQDGYTAVAEEIADPLWKAGAITLETVVTRVDWTNNPILIETNRGTFSAREAVCTIPLGVLKDSTKDDLFTPSLPADKQTAIASLGFGTLDKVFAVYDQPWWNEEPYRSMIRSGLTGVDGQAEDEQPDSFMGFTSELDGISIARNGSVSNGTYRLPIMNLDSLTGQPVLCAFVSCKTATTVEAMEDHDVQALFHRTVTNWFGIEPPRPQGIHVTRWAEDPFSRGSYSHSITSLSEAEHRRTLQTPIINEAGAVLRFAGEHCSEDHFAMVHGALLDGWRAAEDSLQYRK